MSQELGFGWSNPPSFPRTTREFDDCRDEREMTPAQRAGLAFQRALTAEAAKQGGLERITRANRNLILKLLGFYR